MTILAIIAAVVLGLILIGAIVVVSMRITEGKSSQELAQRMPDGSAANHDSSGGMWDGAAGGGD